MEAHKHLCALQGAGLKDLEVFGDSIYFTTKTDVKCEVYLAPENRLCLFVNDIGVSLFPADKPELIAKMFEA